MVKVTAKVKPDGHIWGLEFNRYVCLSFLAEIQQIAYLTLKIQGQGHNENWPKSNQAIYRWGPTIVTKMKEIQKVNQNSLCEQKSAGGGGGVGTSTKTVTPRIPSPGDLMNNKANLRDLIAVTDLVILLKLDPNFLFFGPHDFEIRRINS